MTHLRKLVLAVLAALALRAAPARAVCNQSTASQADRDLWNTHGCWQAFFLWQYKAYDMSGSDWGGSMRSWTASSTSTSGSKRSKRAAATWVTA